MDSMGLGMDAFESPETLTTDRLLSEFAGFLEILSSDPDHSEDTTLCRRGKGVCFVAVPARPHDSEDQNQVRCCSLLWVSGGVEGVQRFLEQEGLQNENSGPGSWRAEVGTATTWQMLESNGR